MKAFVYFILIVVAVVLSLAFTVLNPGVVEVNLYLTRLSLPFSVVIVASILVGILLGFLASITVAMRQRQQLRRYRKQLGDVQTELGRLRKVPLNQP